MNVKIGKQIKALRNRDGVTQDRLADALGVTSQAISKWENEIGYPDIEYIVPIANFFNVTIDALFEHDRSESESKINQYCEKLDETISCYIKKQSNGKFQGTLSVDKWQAAGTFKLVRVTVYDDAGNSATYDKNPWGSQKQLSSKMQALSVKVTATNPDRTDPKLKSISLSATSVKNGGKITVTMKATDDNSGVKSGQSVSVNISSL